VKGNAQPKASESNGPNARTKALLRGLLETTKRSIFAAVPLASSTRKGGKHSAGGLFGAAVILQTGQLDRD
jgi:hypothetical protein